MPTLPPNDPYRELVGLLCDLPQISDPAQRQHLVTATRLGTWRYEVDFTGSAVTFTDAIIGVLVRHGQPALTDFLDDIAHSGFLGADRRQLALDVRRRIEELSAAEFRSIMPGSHRIQPGMVTHVDELSGLSGHLRNLRGDLLPFVEPAPDSDSHPRRVFEALTEADRGPGIIIVGAAGAGKTRTCFEVGNIATDNGFAVYHIKAGEPEVNNEQLTDLILSSPSNRLLLIIDYLNECTGLDPIGIQHQTIPEARRAGKRVALLATARVGWYSQAKARWSGILEKVHLEPDREQSARIKDVMVDRLAPTAIDILGRDRLLKLCGDRPIVAMLIAMAAEERAKAGRITDAVTGLRSGHLLDWLNRRLREDDLVTTTGESLWIDNEPLAQQQACAVMASIAPLAEPRLLSTGTAVLGHDGAEHLLRVLLSMGWMVAGTNAIMCAHDIVADQLLEQTLLSTDSDIVRKAITDRILTGCLTNAQTLGRVAVSLNRITRDLDLEGRGGPLAAFCRQWFVDHGDRIAEVVAESPDEGGYALGRILEYPAWTLALGQTFDSTVTPWLDAYGKRNNSRGILTAMLKRLPPEYASSAFQAAARWIEAEDNRYTSAFLIRPLLESVHSPEDSSQVVAHALSWLETYGKSLTATHVLNPLLSAPLDTGQRTKVTEFSLAWLDGHATTDDAQYVLGALLDNALDRTARNKVLEHALRWLQIHAESIDAQWLIRRVLELAEPPQRIDEFIRYGLGWLDKYTTIPDATYVLGKLLPAATDPADVATATRYALTWLASNARSQSATFVLRALLRVDSDAETYANVGVYALAWLDAHSRSPEASFVLSPVLELELDPDQLDRVFEHARSWLQTTADAVNGLYVLRRMYARRKPEWREFLVERSTAWLRAHHQEKDASHVLCFLLPQEHTARERFDEITNYAMTWLDSYSTSSHASYVLTSLLDNGVDTAQVVQLATGWLEANTAAPESRFLLQRLLSLPDDERTDRVADFALSWLAGVSTASSATYVLTPLLARKLGPERDAVVIAHAKTWLTAHAVAPTAQFILVPLLQRLPADDGVIEQAVRWLESHGEAATARFPLRALLSPSRVTEHTPAIIEAALHWLELHGDTENARFVLQPLLARVDEPESTRRTVDHALVWMEHYGSQMTARFVLASLLQKVTTGEEVATTLRRATNWFDRHGATSEAAYSISALASFESATALPAGAAGYARRWITMHKNSPYAHWVLPVLLKSDPDETDPDTLVELTDTWLRAHGAAKSSRSVIELFLRYCRGGVHDELAVDNALRWLHHHAEVRNAGGLLSRALEIDGGRRPALLDEAFRWLRTNIDAAAARFVLRQALDHYSRAAEFETCLEFALTWVESNSASETAWLVIRSALASNLTGTWRDSFEEQALVWLAAHPISPAAAAVSAAALRNPVPGTSLDEFVRCSMVWLATHSDRDSACDVLIAVANCGGSPPRDSGELVGYARRWLDVNPDHPGSGEVARLLIPAE